MFPFDYDDEEGLEGIEEAGAAAPTDYEIDFEAGRLTGRVVTGLQAVEQHARLLLMTDRYYFHQYGWSHGSELSELVGNGSPGYVAAMARRMVEDALSQDPDIQGIEGFEAVPDGGTLSCSFRILTPYGTGEVEISV